MRFANPKRHGEGNGWVWFLGVAVIGAIIYFVARDHVSVLKPSLPLVISFRGSLLGQGKVAIFSNQSASRLTITCALKSHVKKSKVYTLDLDPNDKRELGWLEGWTFLSGETITVTHPNYSPKIVEVP